MANPGAPRVTSVDRLNDGLVITFSDDRCAFYPTVFLYHGIDQVRELHDKASPAGALAAAAWKDPEWEDAGLRDDSAVTGSSQHRS